MRIAFFHEVHAGGARRSVNEFGKQLKKRHLVDLYYVDAKRNKQEEKNFSHSFFFKHTPKLWKGRNWKIRVFKDTIELYSLYRLHKKIGEIIDNNDYDVVFVDPSQFTQAPFLLRFLKTKSLYYCQEPLRIVYEGILDFPKNTDIIRYRYEKLNRFIRKKIDLKNIHKATLVLANSEYSKTNIKKAYGIDAKVCYMGTNPHIFKLFKIKKDIDILFIGAYEFVDGYDLLKKALKKMKSKPLVKVHASEMEWIKGDKKIQILYSRSKIALCLAYNEPFGLIPLEAMACATPVVAVNEGGYKETIVNGKNGYLISRNANELAEKLDELLASPRKISRLGINGRKYILEKWSWEKRTKELEKIIRQLVKN